MSIAIIFGGKSCEHNVSIVTGVQLLNAVRALDPLPIYIDPNGEWRTGEKLFELDTFKRYDRLKKVYPRPGTNKLYTERGRIAAEMDVAVLCCHGKNGEDGTLQGLLELCGVPYSGADVLGSALCMNKAAFKTFVAAADIPTVPYATFTRREFNDKIYEVADRLNAVGYPFIVKPARLGSSIGVGVARDEAELVNAVRVALEFDDLVIAEKLLENFREFNCAALGDESELIVSEVEEPLGWKEFLSFEDKYSGGKSFMRRRLPADVSADVSDEIKRLTALVFRAVGLSGVVRVDFMLCADGKLYLNEVNTLPGSLAAYFFRQKGMSETALVNKLAEIAVRRAEAAKRLKYSYSSDVLKGK